VLVPSSIVEYSKNNAILFITAGRFKMEMIVCPEMSVTNY